MQTYGLYKSPKDRAMCVRQDLVNQYNYVRDLHRDCADFIMPSRYVENVSESPEVFVARRENIIDGTCSQAVSDFEAGMSSIICSSQRPWFRLMPPDPSLADRESVKEWLQALQDDFYSAYARSNYYLRTPINIGNCGVFGLGAMSLVESVKTMVKSMTFRVGSFRIGVNEDGEVVCFQRDIPLTVRQCVGMFGKYDPRTGRARWELFSDTVRRAWESSNYEQIVLVSHLIEPNLEYDPRMLNKKHALYSSKYWELNASKDSETFLDESGYDFFPILVPRWQAADEKAYATDFPGARAVGDVMQLQNTEKKSLQAIDLMVEPPLKAHPDLMGKTTAIAGGVTWTESDKLIQKLFDVDYNLSHVEQKQAQVRARIKDYMYNPAFRRITNDQRNERATAQEIVAGNQEIFMMLAPPAAQIAKEQLDPTIDISFACWLRQGGLKRRPPPQELHGMPLQIQYLNLMGQAQKMLGNSVQERFIQFEGQVLALHPDAAVASDPIEMLREYADSLGLNPKALRSDDKIKAIQDAQAKAAQAQQQAEQINLASQSARNLSQSDLEGNNALSALGEGAGLTPTGAVPGGF